MKIYTATPIEEDEEGWKTRSQYYCPTREKVDCPPIVSNFIGDSAFAVQDFHRWNDKLEPYRMHFHIKPSFLTSVSKTTGIMSVRPWDREETVKPESVQKETEGDERLSSADGSTDLEGSELSDMDEGRDHLNVEDYMDSLPSDQKSIHMIEGDTRVSIITVGWFVERAIIHNLRKFYKMYTSTIVRFRRKLYKEYAHGDETVPVSVVVERYMDAEKVREAEREMRRRENIKPDRDMDGVSHDLVKNGKLLNKEPLEDSADDSSDWEDSDNDLFNVE